MNIYDDYYLLAHNEHISEDHYVLHTIYMTTTNTHNIYDDYLIHTIFPSPSWVNTVHVVIASAFYCDFCNFSANAALNIAKAGTQKI